MQSEILKRKPIIIKNNEEIVDITTCSVQYINDNPYIIKQIIISEDMAMRPDLVSKIAYGRIDYVDILLKFNGISNPYSLNNGDILLIPELSYLINSLTMPSTKNEYLDIINQYIDPNKKYEVDSNKIEYDENIKKLFKESNANFVKLPLPPNLAQPGSKEGKFIDPTTILLGGDISKNKS